MVKTKADLKGVRVSAKAPRKMPASSLDSPGHSSRKYEGGNSYYPRETPAWQKEITKFFSVIESEENISHSSDSNRPSSSISQRNDT